MKSVTLLIVICLLAASSMNGCLLNHIYPSRYILDAREDYLMCRVHYLEMREDVVPIVYGLPISNPAFESYADSHYPNANNNYLPGCVVHSQRKAKVYYCTQCRIEWEKSKKKKYPKDERLKRTKLIKVCRAHNFEMQEGVVPILYGLPAFNFDFLYDAATMFPNANDHIAGGCVVGYERKATIFYCKQCRTAKAKYHEEQKLKRNNSNVMTE